MTWRARRAQPSPASFWWAPGPLVAALMALALLALGLGAAGAVWLTARALQAPQQQRQTVQQDAEVQMLARLLAGKIEQHQRLLALVASGITPALLESPALVQRWLEQGLPAARWFDSLLLARSHGEVSLYLHHGRVQPADSLQPPMRDALRRALADGKPQFSSPFVDGGGEAQLLLTLPLRREDGSLFAVLGASLRLSTLLAPALSLALPADARLLVFTREGSLLAHPDAARLLGDVRSEPSLEHSPWPAPDEPVTEGVRHWQTPAGLVSLAGMPLPQWWVARVSAAPAPLAQGGWRGQVAAWLLLLALLLVLCMAWLAQPLAQLRHRAPQLLQAESEALQPWPQARGEVNALVEVLSCLGAQRSALQAQLAQQQQQFQAVLEHAPLGIVITRAARLALLNRQACRLLGAQGAALQGLHVGVLHASVADYERLTRQVGQAFRTHGAFHGELCLLRRDGGAVWVRAQAYVLGALHEGAGSLWLLEDLTAERQAQRQQDWQAGHDGLTQLPTRALLEQRLQPLLAQYQEQATAPEEGGVLLFLDMDHFAVINDEAGHEAGNDLLRQVAHFLQNQVRAMGWAARVGGDEFALVLPGCSLQRGQALAQALCSTLQGWQPCYQGRSFTLSASVGLVHLAGGFANVADLLHAADMACYGAKRAGRNRVLLG